MTQSSPTPSQSQQPQKKRPTRRLEVSQEELEKVQRLKSQFEAADDSVDAEWYALAEFTYYYGWQAYRDAVDNKILIEEMRMLTLAARKVWAGRAIDIAHATFVGYAAAQSKSPSKTFQKGIESFQKAAKVET